MEPIDVSLSNFVRLREEVSGYINSLTTEADARLKVIDRVLTEVLLWPLAELSAEAPLPDGFADYVCSVEQRARLVVEAKRDGAPLGCEGRQPGRAFKLSGGVFANTYAKDGIGQAIRYCAERGAELACVTNGREWIVFRGNRLADGLAVREGVGFVFPNLVAIEDHFALFYNLMSYESANRRNYRPYFHEAEGQPIRRSIFNKALRSPQSIRFQTVGGLSADIEKVMSSFFRRLIGDEDPDLLDACFVETRESRHADTQLARIAESLATRIRTLDTEHGSALTDLIHRARETGRHEFVLIVGTKGAGKSTFITRFFKSVLPEGIAKTCIVLRVDLGTSTPDRDGLVDWLDDALVSQAESTLFKDGATYEEIQGIFFDEYKRLLKGPWAALHGSDPTAFHVRFGDHIEELRRRSPHEYLLGMLRHVATNRHMLPVVVLDNADHFPIDFQQYVYQYARSIYEQTLCLMILPITDRTSWQLTKHGALQSFEHEALFLPTPPTEAIIRKRISFMEERVRTERERPDDRYFIGRGISLSIDDLSAFTRALQRAFLGQSDVSGWLGDLANHDIRRTLVLARSFISSPHLRVQDLVSAYVAGDSGDVPAYRASRALVRQQYDIYPSGMNDYVQNVFPLNTDLETTPLLGLRLFQLLSDVPVSEHEGSLIEVDEVVAYCVGMNIETRAVSLWLDAMLKTGLLQDYDPTTQEISQARQIEIAPSGRHHLRWATGNTEYLGAMSEVTQLLSETSYQQLRALKAYDWRPRCAIFLQYLLSEDQAYCSLPDHPAYDSQRRLTESIRGVATRLSA